MSIIFQHQITVQRLKKGKNLQIQETKDCAANKLRYVRWLVLACATTARSYDELCLRLRTLTKPRKI